MQEAQCVTCSCSFDYFKKVATTICESNHIVCKQCADKLYKSKSKCPHCLSPLLGTNPYGIRQSYDDKNNNNNYQPAPNSYPPINPNQYLPTNHNQYSPFNQNQYANLPRGQPIPQSFINGQPVVQAHQPPIPFQVRPQNTLRGYFLRPKKFLCCTIIAFLIFIACLITRIKMNSCQFWSYRGCYDLRNDSYMCCPYTSSCSSASWAICSSINSVRDQSFVIGITITLVASAIMFIVSLANYSRSQRLRRGYLVQVPANYVQI